MLSQFFSRKSRGFTLVELLIVVAIIGVLSTLGVPTFRRMIQKSKKAEAKVELGGLFTAESAFNAEYSAYGNNLNGLGFQVEGNPAGLIYYVGFANAGTTYPNTGTAATNLQTAYPGYYNTNVAYTAGFNGLNNNVCKASGSCGLTSDSDSSADGKTFYAVAQGVISPNFKTDGSDGATSIDVWAIDNNRTLTNNQDGVN